MRRFVVALECRLLVRLERSSQDRERSAKDECDAIPSVRTPGGDSRRDTGRYEVKVDTQVAEHG